jgi:hypothetical protein
MQEERLMTVAVDMNDYISGRFVFPVEVDRRDRVAEAFVGTPRSLVDLIGLFKVEIVQKLVPGLNKEGYQEASQHVQSSQPRRASPPPEPRAERHPLRVPPRGPFGIGSDDLNPFGPVRGGPFGGNGMFMGPDHPLFTGGHPGLLPPGAVPPNARFDPISPYQPGVGRGRGNRRFLSGEPDNDELAPPGYNDMFM